MDNRLLKQLLYGFFYILIFVGIATIVYFITIRPEPTCFDGKRNQGEAGIDCGGPCVSCALKNIKSPFVGPAIMFGADRAYSTAAQIQNLNADFGARSFDYEAIFYGAGGNVLRKVSGKDFIYPGEAKNIIEAGARIVTGVPERAEIKLVNAENIAWEHKDDFFEPDYDYDSQKTAATIQGERVKINGFVINVNNFPLSKIIISAFAVDNLGVKAGVSETALENLNPFDARNFDIFIPVPKSALNSIDLEATKMSVVIEIIK